MSGITLLESSNCNYIKANVSNSHNNNVAFEMKFSKDLTIDQLKVSRYSRHILYRSYD